MSTPVDVIAQAIRTADGSHTLGASALAEVAAAALTDDRVVANAVQALKEDGWLSGAVKAEPLNYIALVVLASVGGQP